MLGSHCDDIELGCGGTLHKHKNDWDVTCVVFMKNADHIEYPNIDLHCEKALEILGIKKVHFFDLPVNNHYSQRQTIWEIMHNFDESINPDLVISQHCDQNQDHRTLCEESMRNFRKSSLVTYCSTVRNCISFDYTNFEILSQSDVDAKLMALNEYYMYKDKPYFKPENVVAFLRSQAVYVEAEFAETFRTVKAFGL